MAAAQRAAAELVGRLSVAHRQFRLIEPQLQAFVAELPSSSHSGQDTDIEARFQRLQRELRQLLWPAQRARAARTSGSRARPPTSTELENNNLPLHGALLAVKDNIDVCGLPTALGVSSSTRQPPPDDLRQPKAADAEIVARLRKAGALVVGKSHCTQLCSYAATPPTGNPACPPGYTPGGSSAGSAAAVSAGLCDLALGTQTVGSVVRPAAYTGVCGLVLPWASVSMVGVAPMAPSHDCIGLFASSPSILRRAAAILLDQPFDTDARPITRKRWGVPSPAFLQLASTNMRRRFDDVLLYLEQEGHEVMLTKQLFDAESLQATIRAHRIITAFEFVQHYRLWLQDTTFGWHSEVRKLAQAGAAVSPDDYHQALAFKDRLRAQIHGLQDTLGIAAWLTPATSTLPPAASEKSTGDPIMSLPWTFVGASAGAVPAGLMAEAPLSPALPFAIQAACVPSPSAQEPLTDPLRCADALIHLQNALAHYPH